MTRAPPTEDAAPPRVLFVSGEPHLPGALGGAERSVDELVRACLARGVACEVLAGVARGGPRRRFRLRRFLAGRGRVALPDRLCGYPTHRAIPRRIVDALRERLAAARPGLVVSWNRAAAEVARAADAAGVPTLVWIHDATFSWLEGSLPNATRLAAVSGFLAARARERTGRPVALLRPPVVLDRVRCDAHPGGRVTLVNPRVRKGLGVALEVARRLPHRRFLLVGSDGVPREERATLAAAVRGLPNVAVERSAADMRDVYARTSLLLVPSRCEDAAPRVVLEAHANGIPVLGSEAGGIPEVSGGASVLLPLDAPPQRWAEEVERVLSDPAVREDLARRGRANAARPELTAEAAVAAFLALAREAAARQ